MNQPQAKDNQKITLILQQIESLPTLPAILVKLLKVLDADKSNAQEVVELVQSDMALCSKIISLSQRMAKNINRQEITSIDRAVVLLGFDAIRNAILSVKIIEHLKQKDNSDPKANKLKQFDHTEFWLHSLAVAVTAELLARLNPQLNIKPADAFLCGLLHDIGKLGLDHILPKSYQKVVQAVELRHADIADCERQIIGLDHHTAGKRLAEHWQLPHILIDCIWLHGTPIERLPELPHRNTVALTTLADIIARRQHIGYSGNYANRLTLEAQATGLNIPTDNLEELTPIIHQEVNARAQTLGLTQKVDQNQFLTSLIKANTQLGRLNEKLNLKSTAADEQALVINTITDFNKRITTPGRSVLDILSYITQSSINTFGKGFYATIYQSRNDLHWTLTTYDDDGSILESHFIDNIPDTPDITQMTNEQFSINEILKKLPDSRQTLATHVDLKQLNALHLTCGWGTAAILIHNKNIILEPEQRKALTSTFGAAVASASQHEGARRIGEELIEVQRQLADAQDTMLQQKSLAKIGEVAAGAAHEMNNPLMVISGRSQLLATTLEEPKDRAAAQQIAEQSLRLSDMITALRTLAEIPNVNIQSIELTDVLEETLHKITQTLDHAPAPYVAIPDETPALQTDPELLSIALFEILRNAYEANPTKPIEIKSYIDVFDNQLIIQIQDNGAGMDSHILEHAFDPFFSAKPAGRQPGLGLANAQQAMNTLKGDIKITSSPHNGTVVTIAHPIEPVINNQNTQQTTATHGSETVTDPTR